MRCRRSSSKHTSVASATEVGGDAPAREPLAHPVADRGRRERAARDAPHVQLSGDLAVVLHDERHAGAVAILLQQATHADAHVERDRAVGARRLPRPQPRAVREQLLLEHAGVALAHQADRHRSMPTGSRQIHDDPPRTDGATERRRELLEPGSQLGAEILAIRGELHDGLDVVHPIAGVVATAAENDAVHAGAVGVRGELLQRVGELDLAALAGLGALEDVEDRRASARSGRSRRGSTGASSGLGFSTSPVTRTTSVGRRSPRPRPRRTCRCGRGRPP